MSEATVGVRRRRLPRTHLSGVGRVWALDVVLALTAGVIYRTSTARLPSFDGPVSVPWWAFALMFCAAEVTVVHIQFRRDAHSFSLSEVAIVLGLFFTSPRGLLLAQLVGAGTALVVHRRQSVLKLLFNLSNFCVQVGLATAIFHALSGGSGLGPRAWGAALAATAIPGFLGVALIFIAISASHGSLEFTQFPRALIFGLIVTVTNTCMGLIGVSVIASNPFAAALLLVPAATLFLAYRAYTGEREKNQSLEFLYESTRIIQQSAETEAAMLALLSQSRKMFRAEYAEMRIFPTQENQYVLRTSLGPEERVSAMQSAGREFATGVCARVVIEDRAVLLPRPVREEALIRSLPELTVKDAMIAPLRGETRAIGVLVVVNRLGDVSTFDEADLKLFETFTNHASIALENGRLEKSLAQLTELKEQLRFQALHDPLTGLANRVLFTDRVEHVLQRGGRGPEPMAILFVDLDNFKTVNDSLGHASGDELLRGVAARIERVLRPGDTAARLGGDEFAVLLEGLDADGSERVAERILEALRTPVALDGSHVLVCASIGIAAGVPGHVRADELLRNADVAMYVAKSEGKGRYAVFEPAMHESVLGRMEMEADLRAAINNGDLDVAYQPIVSLADGAVVGAEALVRWSHPFRGNIPPEQFIHIAEDAGLIVPIGRFVLGEACRAARAWESVDPEFARLRVSVNVSPRQLQQAAFTDEVARALAESGLDGRRLVLEVTESAMMRDAESTADRLAQLKTLGVGVAIDDFGTGYSALTYLQRLPVDLLKIDKSFVDGLLGGPEDAALAKAVIHIGKSLSLGTIAEGIEHESQLRQLRDLGCEMGQGFLFATPLDGASMEAFLLARAQCGLARSA